MSAIVTVPLCLAIFCFSFLLSVSREGCASLVRHFMGNAICASARQNQQNGMCAQRRLRSAWASTQSDQSLLRDHFVAKDPIFLHADSEEFAQTGQTVSRLIWIFAGRSCHFVGFVMCWLIYTFCSAYKNCA